jgi:hypothetical protein
MTLEEEEEEEAQALSLSLSLRSKPTKCTKKYDHFGFPFPGDDGIKNVRERKTPSCVIPFPPPSSLSLSLSLSLS